MSRGAQLKDKTSQVPLIGIATWGIVDQRENLTDSKVRVVFHLARVHIFLSLVLIIGTLSRLLDHVVLSMTRNLLLTCLWFCEIQGETAKLMKTCKAANKKQNNV